MNSQNLRASRSHDVPLAYRAIRALLRLGVWLFFPKLRLLNHEKLEQDGPSILLVAHPQSLLAALLLVAALERPVHCLLPARQLRGLFRRLAGLVPGIRTYDSLPEEQDSLLNPCRRVLENQGIIVLFAGQFEQNSSHRAPIADFAARVALEVILSGQGQLQPAICPVHWFLRTQRRGSEPLIYIDGPIEVQPFLPRIGESVAEAPRRLAEIVQNAVGANVFSLTDPEAERFSHELETLSREHLEMQWAQRTEWKQRVEDFKLSSFVKTWIEEQNRMDPARLVELREAMNGYREAHRRCSLGQLIFEAAGSWQESSLHLAAAWAESVLGFPIAVYGTLNHLPAGIVLAISGLLKKSSKRDPKVEWLLRIFIVLSFYTAQVFLVHLGWGRAAAGYYALTLPASGGYLLRYRWLVRNRTRVLVLKALLPRRTSRLLRTREKILGNFSQEMERYPQSPVIPFERSPNLAE